MIIYKSTHEGKECRREIETGGTLAEIIDDCCSLIGSIYNGMKKASQKDAEILRMGCMVALLPDSPVWKPADPKQIEREETTLIEIKK